jgi:hypothetical protein
MNLEEFIFNHQFRANQSDSLIQARLALGSDCAGFDDSIRPLELCVYPTWIH